MSANDRFIDWREKASQHIIASCMKYYGENLIQLIMAQSQLCLRRNEMHLTKQKVIALFR